MATSYTTSVTPSLNRFAPWLSLHRQSRSYSTVPSILADQQIFSTRAKHLASKYSDRPRSLFDAHSPRQPSVSPASLAFSAQESFTMHVSYLIICPRLTLRVAVVNRRTDGHADTQTDYNNPRCACAQARVNNSCPIAPFNID